MNNILTGVVTTIIALGTIGATAPKQSAPPPPTMTQEQGEALRQAFNLPPGSEIEVEISNRDEGSVKTSSQGRGVGAGAVAEGDELSDQFTGSPPAVGLGADGSQSATGGGAARRASAEALRIPPLPWQNPMFWIGLLSLGAAGLCVYAGLRRAAVICGVAGAGLLAAAFYPAILLFAVAGVLLVLAAPYIKAELEARRNREALRAVVAGVDAPTVSEEAKQAVKAAVAREADDKDRATIKAVKMADSVGKYED